MKFSIKDFFSKCDQIRSFLPIWSHLPNKSLIENFIFCAVKCFVKIAFLFRLCREINILRNLVVIKHLTDRDLEINRLSQTVTKLDQKIKQALKEIRKYTGIYIFFWIWLVPFPNHS